jgi:hypothetical protein
LQRTFSLDQRRRTPVVAVKVQKVEVLRMNTLTPAQLAWLHKNQDYSPISKPRSDVRYRDVGTLHGDGTFEPCTWSRPGSLLRNPVKLRPDGISIGVGVKMASAPFPGWPD